jgi:hypothetical protein
MHTNGERADMLLFLETAIISRKRSGGCDELPERRRRGGNAVFGVTLFVSL